jgi:hypothetical protein
MKLEPLAGEGLSLEFDVRIQNTEQDGRRAAKRERKQQLMGPIFGSHAVASQAPLDFDMSIACEAFSVWTCISGHPQSSAIFTVQHTCTGGVTALIIRTLHRGSRHKDPSALSPAYRVWNANCSVLELE